MHPATIAPGSQELQDPVAEGFCKEGLVKHIEGRSRTPAEALRAYYRTLPDIARRRAYRQMLSEPDAKGVRHGVPPMALEDYESYPVVARCIERQAAELARRKDVIERCAWLKRPGGEQEYAVTRAERLEWFKRIAEEQWAFIRARATSGDHEDVPGYESGWVKVTQRSIITDRFGEREIRERVRLRPFDEGRVHRAFARDWDFAG